MADDMSLLPEALQLRFERLMEVVALASLGEFAEAQTHFVKPQEDAFGMLEEGLRVFIAELMATRDERDRTMDALLRAKDELEQKLTLIEDQRARIRELSSPILDVWDGVLAVPLVGRIDHAGMLDVTEKLLHRVVAVRARWALVDLTGVERVDAMTADLLVQLARAVALIGSRCIFTGIGPAAAEALANLGPAPGGFLSLPSLRDGLHPAGPVLRGAAASRPGIACRARWARRTLRRCSRRCSRRCASVTACASPGPRPTARETPARRPRPTRTWTASVAT